MGYTVAGSEQEPSETGVEHGGNAYKPSSKNRRLFRPTRLLLTVHLQFRTSPFSFSPTSLPTCSGSRSPLPSSRMHFLDESSSEPGFRHLPERTRYDQRLCRDGSPSRLTVVAFRFRFPITCSSSPTVSCLLSRLYLLSLAQNLS